jgi:hypothetical protein
MNTKRVTDPGQPLFTKPQKSSHAHAHPKLKKKKSPFQLTEVHEDSGEEIMSVTNRKPSDNTSHAIHLSSTINRALNFSRPPIENIPNFQSYNHNTPPKVPSPNDDSEMFQESYALKLQKERSTEIPNDIIFAMQSHLETNLGLARKQPDEYSMDTEPLIHRRNFDKLFGEGDMAMQEEIHAHSNINNVDAGSVGEFELKTPNLSQHNPFGSIMNSRPLIGTNLFGNFEKRKSEKRKSDTPIVGKDTFDWTFDVKKNHGSYRFPKPKKGNKMSDLFGNGGAIGIVFGYLKYFVENELSLSSKSSQGKRHGAGVNSSDNSNVCEMLSRFDQDFKIIKCIGSGNFGKVFECSNRLDGVRYAVKITNGDVKSK